MPQFQTPPDTRDAELSPERFYSQMLEDLQPAAMLSLMNQLGGAGLKERFAAANVFWLQRVTRFALQRLAQGKKVE